MVKNETHRNRIILRTAIGSQIDSQGRTTIAKYDEDREYSLADESDVCGGGEPMDVFYLIDCIKAHYKVLDERLADALTRNDKDEQKMIEEESIAITLGKESLMLILSQKECEGIRFYFCKNPMGRNSVAAVGVRIMRDSLGAPMIENGRVIAQDIGVEDDQYSILRSQKVNPSTLDMEVGPPYTYGQLKKPMTAAGFREDAFIKSLRDAFK